MDGQVVLVTGCSYPTGFGAAACVQLLARGHRPYASMRDPEGRNTKPAATLREAGIPVLALDVTDNDDVAAAVARVLDEHGRIDALVNNAALITAGALEETTPERLLSVLDANVVGPHRLIRAVLPHMRAAKAGAIVQVSSVNGFYPEPIMGPYSASKHAMNAYSDALSFEVAPFGIRVVIVEPGSFSTGVDERIDWEAGTLDEASPYTSTRIAMWGGPDGEAVDESSADPVEVVDAIVRAIEDPATPLHLVVGDDGREIAERMGYAASIDAWNRIIREDLGLAT